MLYIDKYWQFNPYKLLCLVPILRSVISAGSDQIAHHAVFDQDRHCLHEELIRNYLNKKKKEHAKPQST